MKKLSVLILLMGVFLSAQNNRVVYEYTFRPDSTKIDSLNKEWMYLDINKNGSQFYSKKAFDRDSIITESIKKQKAAGMRSISVSQEQSTGNINFEVEKTYPDYKIFLIANAGNDRYKVAEDRKIIWKILSDKKQLQTYNVQKATTDFAGRNWVAWFTTEIPIQDGPYKFAGLPGLIVEIADLSGSHKMELKGLFKNKTVQNGEADLDLKDIPFTKHKPLEVNRKQYGKKLREFENDPVQGMREILAQPNSKVKVNINGKEITDPKEILRSLEENARDEIRKDNNKIELLP